MISECEYRIEDVAGKSPAHAVCVEASEAELLSAAKTGNQYAFVELCGRSTRSVKRRIFRIVRNREDTEDVLQDTLLRAYKHVGKFRGSCSFQTWLSLIATNSALMLLRKRKSLSETSFMIADEETDLRGSWEVADVSPNPEQACFNRQTSQRLKQAVSRLPASFRSILEHYHLNEMRLTDAASALGISESAAKSRLLRARAALRRRLKNPVDRLAMRAVVHGSPSRMLAMPICTNATCDLKSPSPD